MEGRVIVDRHVYEVEETEWAKYYVVASSYGEAEQMALSHNPGLYISNIKLHDVEVIDDYSDDCLDSEECYND